MNGITVCVRRMTLRRVATLAISLTALLFVTGSWSTGLAASPTSIIIAGNGGAFEQAAALNTTAPSNPVSCPNGQCFTDVTPANTFFAYINSLYMDDIISGYPCGGTGEPCDGQHRPYYRPANNVTRGQMSKFVDNGRRNIADAVGLSLTLSNTYAAISPLVITTTGATGVTISAVGSTTGIAATTETGTAIQGSSTGGYGIRGDSPSGTGVSGLSDSQDGVAGQSNTGNGVVGTSNAGYGVWGSSGSVGVYGESANNTGIGVYGRDDLGVGVHGQSDSGTGVAGSSTSHIGVAGQSISYYGVYGGSNSNDGVHGISTSGYGVYGESGSNYGIYGTTSGDATVAAVTGTSTNSRGVYGSSTNNVGVYGDTANSSTGWAGWFQGRITVVGGCTGCFGPSQVDDPLDPANKYLNQSPVQSDDMTDIYSGNATTGADGLATVQLPDYFQTLNRDFRYQLTPIGQFAQAIIWQQVKDNSFVIKTDKPNVEVSWQVTGTRQDAYANAHRTPAEVQKPADEQGLYLYPQLYGQPDSKGLSYNKFSQSGK